MQKAVHSNLVSVASVVSSNRHNELQKITITLFKCAGSPQRSLVKNCRFDFITCRLLLKFTLQIGDGLRTLQLNCMFTCETFIMLSIWFNVACVIYNILERLNVASKTVLMNTDDLYSTLLVITPILQFQNTFLPAIIPTIICFWFLLKNLKMGVILSGKHVKPTLSIKLRQLSLWASINVMNCNYI